MIGRCPLCHDACTPQEPAIACRSCLAVHHAECWCERERCAACGGVRALREGGGSALHGPVASRLLLGLFAVSATFSCVAIVPAMVAMTRAPVVGALFFLAVLASGIASLSFLVSSLTSPPVGSARELTAAPLQVRVVRRQTSVEAEPPVHDWPPGVTSAEPSS